MLLSSRWPNDWLRSPLLDPDQTLPQVAMAQYAWRPDLRAGDRPHVAALRVPHSLVPSKARCRIERPLPRLRPPGQTVRCHFPLA
jgi:hypothetical protein